MQSPLSFGKATGYARASQVALPAAAVPAQVLGQQPQGGPLLLGSQQVPLLLGSLHVVVDTNVHRGSC